MRAPARRTYKGSGERLHEAALALAEAESAEEYEAAQRSLWRSARAFSDDATAREAAKLAQAHESAREWLRRRGFNPGGYRAGDGAEWIDEAEAA